MNIVQFRKKSSSSERSITQAVPMEAFTPPPPGVKAIGIDLGTTNSVVSLLEEHAERPRSLEFEGHVLVPSMFLYEPDEDRELIGVSARSRLVEHTADIVRGTKRFMGTTEGKFQSNAHAYTPEQAAEIVLRYLSSHPELVQEKEKHGAIWAVVTVPSHFDDAARQATLAAAQKAGIHVIRIVNEPTAAALAYSMFPDIDQSEQENVAVFDFGGGTFDVSIVARDGLVFNVLSSEGDVYLGGDDIDSALAEHLRQFVTPVLSARRAAANSALFRRLTVLAEQAKCIFQTEGSTRICDDNLDGFGAKIDTVLSRDEFDRVCQPFIQRTLELTERAMHAARLQPKQISRILLVGGSSRLALVQTALSSYFTSCLVDARLEPDLAVSWGATLQAAIILGLKPETVLVDVCSHTLGIGVAEDSNAIDEDFKRICKKFGLPRNLSEREIRERLGSRVYQFHTEIQKLLRVASIIHRNSPLPAKRSEFFSTIYANQEAVHVVVVQGEGERVGDNRLLGEFLFSLEQPCPAGTRCEIQLTYDVNGMVHVLARQIGTQNQSVARFDSRTGKVNGWEPIEIDEATEAVGAAESMERGVIPLFGGMGSAGNSISNQPLNAIILRARRAVKALPLDSELGLQLARALDTYTDLLAAAHSGIENDEVLESAEQLILEILEGI